ncbi:MAG: helix-turn-helix transcriptional regulator [Clostridia bacterium]|nr:helix-turn-helix transcriptional regulator [Clostridia bacterium]
MKIGEKIRNSREDMDMSQEDVSKLIPMNQSSYSKIERDIQEPSLEQLRRICQILNIDPSYLLSLGDYENSTNNDVRFAKEVKRLYEKIYM